MATGPFAVAGNAKGERGTSVNVPSPLPLNTEYVLSVKFVTTKPGLESPVRELNVPIAIALGCIPTGMGVAGVLNVPSPFPSSTITVFPTGSATSKSAKLSLFAALDDAFRLPVAKAGAGVVELVQFVPSATGET